MRTNNNTSVQNEQHLQVELSKKVGQISEVSPTMNYYYKRRNSAYLDLVPKMFLPVKEKLFREHEANVLETEMNFIEEHQRVKGEYNLSALIEVVNTRLENVKSILRKERGVHLVGQLKEMIEDLFDKEKEFESETLIRDNEIEGITNPYLQNKAREGWKNKIDTYYEVAEESINRFKQIVAEAIK